MIKCPNCGASHYSEGPSMRTAVYYPPVWKDGVNTNPDRNTTTTKAHCYECNYDFIIKECAGEVWTEQGQYNPPKSPLNGDITAGAYTTTEYVPIEAQTKIATATINLETGEAMRQKYQWEVDIEELQKQVKELKNEISTLRDVLIAAIEILK